MARSSAGPRRIEGFKDFYVLAASSPFDCSGLVFRVGISVAEVSNSVLSNTFAGKDCEREAVKAGGIYGIHGPALRLPVFVRTRLWSGSLGELKEVPLTPFNPKVITPRLGIANVQVLHLFLLQQSCDQWFDFPVLDLLLNQQLPSRSIRHQGQPMAAQVFRKTGIVSKPFA